MTYRFPRSEILSKVCKASLKHEASLGWGLKSIKSHNPFFHLKILLHFLSLHLSWPRVWRLPFHCPLSWLLCSSSLGARARGGALCLCGQSLCRALPTAPDCHVPLWATHWWVSRAVSVTCRFIYCAAKDSCVQRVSQHLLGQELPVTALGTAKMNSIFKMLLDLPWRNKECAHCLRLQSFIVDLSYLQLNPKTSRTQTLDPANPAQPHGRGGLCCPLLSLRKAREPHGIAKSALASGTASAALACHRP